MTTSASIQRRTVAEAIGTMLLLATVVGSGIMGERLSGGNVGLALLANTIATGAVLVALILAFGPLSGAHLNPVVTLSAAWERDVPWSEVPPYVVAQVLGALLGVALAHAMFALPTFVPSLRERSGLPQLLSELIATFGLVGVILGCSRQRSALAVPFAVGAYITAAYWFTASTSFANPAVTLARSLTDSFSGIRIADVPGFVLAQLTGAAGATFVFGWLVPPARATAGPHVDPKTSHARPYEEARWKR